MKSKLQLLGFTALIFFSVSCGGGSTSTTSESTSPEDVGAEDVGAEDVNATDNEKTFDEFFKKLPGSVTTDTTIQYTTLSAQAASSTLDVITTELPESCAATPTRIAGLTSGTDFFYHKFENNTSAGASAMGFTGSIGRKEAVIIQDFVRYKNIKCDGKQTKVGVGLRSYIHIKSFKGKIEGTLAQIAANVELGRAQASFSIKSLGFPIEGDVIAEGMSTQGEYTVENFAKLTVIHNNILRLIKSSSTMEIDPVIISE